MNSNIPVAASACAQDYRVLRRLLAGEERLQVLKTFNFHLGYGDHTTHTHTHIHGFHFHINLGLISFLEFVQTFIMPHSQYNLGPIHNTIFLCTVASHPHINSVLSHKKAKTIHNTVLVMLVNKWKRFWNTVTSWKQFAQRNSCLEITLLDLTSRNLKVPANNGLFCSG